MKKYIGVVLLIAAITFSAFESIPDIIAKWDAYQKKYPQVKLHLIFNQEKYAPGDTAFFKAYFLTEDFKPVAQKQILTLQVKDHEGSNVHVQNFRINEGEGNNQIIFSNKIAPGEYTIIAYSEWMRNFDEKLFFTKPIVLAGRREVVKSALKSDSLAFFPEGGQLVAGVENRLIVKSGRQGAGKIMNQQGSLVAEFTIPKSGIDELVLTPEKGSSYYAELTGLNSRFPLMESIEDGCAMKVNATGMGQVEVSLLTSTSSSLRKQDLSLVATANGRIVYTTAFRMDDGHASINVDNLSPGLNQFYVFDKKDNVLAERIYYVRPQLPNAVIQLNEEDIKPRGMVDFDILIEDRNGRPVSGAATVSVVNQALFPQSPESSFGNEMILFNDLPDLRDNFKKSGLTEENWLAGINDQLITTKWRRTEWEDILNGRKGKTDYDFKYSLNLKGDARFRGTGDPVPDSTLIMIYQQKSMVGYETYTNKSGEFVFPFIYDFNGNDQVFYMMDFPKRVKQDDYVIHPELVINTTSAASSQETDTPDRYGEYIFRKRIIDKSFSFFIAPEKAIEAKIINPNSEFEDELGGVDVNIKVDEFVVFPTMSDLIHEVIGGLQVRRINDKQGVRVVFIRNTYTVIPKGDPLYIIDGVFTKNTEFFLNLNPEDVYTIKLVNQERKLQRFGEMGKNGIVLVQTKKSVANKVVASSTVFPISGLSDEIEFKSPTYTGTTQSHVPDLRSTLYWNPKITMGANGKATVKFYTSDDAGPMTIKVSGLTINGQPFSAEKTIIVKAPEIKN